MEQSRRNVIARRFLSLSLREIVVAEFISALVGDKTRPYGICHCEERK